MTAPTPSQTVGPFFRFGLAVGVPHRVVDAAHPGAFTLSGRVLDGAGDPVPDAVVELWQADEAGGFPVSWNGFARCLTDVDGRYETVAVKPGAVDESQAPHIDVSVFARGLLQRLVTRIYFPDEAANATDPFLLSVPEHRRGTLMMSGGGIFDIRFQGPDETVFCAW
jgi:protocatechuate 3,4-dioxygenase alpha subunit